MSRKGHLPPVQDGCATENERIDGKVEGGYIVAPMNADVNAFMDVLKKARPPLEIAESSVARNPDWWAERLRRQAEAARNGAKSRK